MWPCLSLDAVSLASSAQVAPQILTDKQQKELVYRRRLQFAAGELTKPLIPSTESSLLAANKNRHAVQSAKLIAEDQPLQPLLVTHFRSSMDVGGGAFYSLPVDVFESLPLKNLCDAVTTSLAIQDVQHIGGKRPVQQPALLPLADQTKAMPLRDRPGARLNQEEKTGAIANLSPMVDMESDQVSEHHIPERGHGLTCGAGLAWHGHESWSWFVVFSLGSCYQTRLGGLESGGFEFECSCSRMSPVANSRGER